VSTFAAACEGNMHGRCAWLHSMSIHVNAAFAIAGLFGVTAPWRLSWTRRPANVLALACIIEDTAFKFPVNLSKISGLHCCFQYDSGLSPGVG
jgi:hypothetical protein